MKLFNLIELRFNQFIHSIKNYLSQSLPDYDSTYGNHTVFGQLINVLHGVVQNMTLYIEDSLVEQNKYTAQRKKSIYGLASISGYQPSLGKASGVQLKLNYTVSNVLNLNIILNNKTELTCTQNGLIYNLILPQEAIVLSIDRDNSTKYLYAVQGRFESQTFISTGGLLYSQHVNFTSNMDTEYLTVSINDEIWEYCESLYDMIPGGKQWTYRISPIGGIDIVFGNDEHGQSLDNGDVIKVSYLLHDGEAGNLSITDETYFIFNNPLYDITGTEVDGNSTFNVTFASQDAVTSGSNSESIEQVRQMIGLNSRSLVLTSPNNYKTFLSKFSFCGYNRTWTEKGSMVVNSLIMRNYKLNLKKGLDYFSLQPEDFMLTDQQKTSIKNCIENTGNQLAGVSYNIFDPVLCKYALYVYLTLKNANTDKEYVSSKVRNLVGEFFSDVQSDIFIPKSDLIQLIKNEVEEVDGVDLYFLSERNETALQTGWYTSTSYDFDPSLGYYKKKQQTVYLYPGENPNIGLDAHGNILLSNNEQFPVLMGNWDFLNDEGQEVTISDPLVIIYE